MRLKRGDRVVRSRDNKDVFFWNLMLYSVQVNWVV